MGSIGNTSKKIKCLRCGKCCVVFDREHGVWSPCKFLRIIPAGRGKTRCQIYNRRLGTDLGNGFKCRLRSQVSFDYPGCPYNTGKPMHPAYRPRYLIDDPLYTITK